MIFLQYGRYSKIFYISSGSATNDRHKSITRAFVVVNLALQDLAEGSMPKPSMNHKKIYKPPHQDEA